MSACNIIAALISAYNVNIEDASQLSNDEIVMFTQIKELFDIILENHVEVIEEEEVVFLTQDDTSQHVPVPTSRKRKCAHAEVEFDKNKPFADDDRGRPRKDTQDYDPFLLFQMYCAIKEKGHAYAQKQFKKTRRQIDQIVNHIECNGEMRKIAMVRAYVLDKFTDARSDYRQVTRSDLERWLAEGKHILNLRTPYSVKVIWNYLKSF